MPTRVSATCSGTPSQRTSRSSAIALAPRSRAAADGRHFPPARRPEIEQAAPRDNGQIRAQAAALAEAPQHVEIATEQARPEP